MQRKQKKQILLVPLSPAQSPVTLASLQHPKEQIFFPIPSSPSRCWPQRPTLAVPAAPRKNMNPVIPLSPSNRQLQRPSPAVPAALKEENPRHPLFGQRSPVTAPSPSQPAVRKMLSPLSAQQLPATAPYPSSACSAQSSESPSFPFRPANASHSAQLSQPAALTEQKLPSIFHSQPQPHSTASSTQLKKNTLPCLVPPPTPHHCDGPEGKIEQHSTAQTQHSPGKAHSTATAPQHY